MSATKDLIFSVDIETTGLVPFTNSLLSVGLVAIRDNAIYSTMSANVKQLPWGSWDADTVDFWDKNPEALKIALANPCSPEIVFSDLGDWVEGLLREDEQPVFVASPVGFDFTWMSMYGNFYAPDKWPFNFAAKDMRTMASEALGVPYSNASSYYWPERYKPWKNPLPHVALNDAISQAYSYAAISRDLEVMRSKANAYDMRGVHTGRYSCQ